MSRASQIVLVVAWVVAGLIGGVPAPADAVDPRPLGETVTRLPRGRLATSLEGGHSCMVAADGTVKCWGQNALGQVGDGTTTTPTTAVRVTGISTAVAVTTGRDHSCALLVDATVRCWGANAVGQLGNGSTTSSLAPVVVSGLTNAVSISAGSRHTCARRSDGTAVCWGSNEFGQLGDNTVVDRLLPVAAQGLANVRMVAAGATHTCAVRVDGTVACWGGNGSGQLGLGDVLQRRVPITVPGLAGVWIVAVGFRYSCAQLGNAETQCWGTNQFGQFGNNTTTSSSSPVVVGNVLFSAKTTLALGHAHTCSFQGGGPVISCSGQNAAGQIGLRTTGAPELFPRAVADVDQTVEVVAGFDRTCALGAGDSVLCWGENSARQLGNGSTTDALEPTAVGGLGGAVSARGVAAGLGHTCAWRADGSLACWGRNASGALGDGTFLERHAPVSVTGATNIMAVVGGDHHTCAWSASGLLSCWGHNVDGQVDPDAADDFIRTPLPLISGGFINYAAGARHSMRLLMQNDPARTTLGWGDNQALQLGDAASDFPPFASFVVAAPLSEAVSVVAGLQHTCALQTRGTVRCWGSNQFGQLGTNSAVTAPNATPQLVQGIVDAVAIGAGQFHTCAVLVAGGVRCWGRNDFGQLGDGTRTDRRAPVPVAGVTAGAAVGVVAGRTYSCFLRATGGVQCWGANARGELGDTTLTDRLTPVFVRHATLFLQGQPVLSQAVTLSQVVGLVGGNTHVCAVRVNGQPVCWGNNDNGQLGDGSTVDRRVAIGVPSFLANIAPEGDVSGNGRRAEVTALVNCPEGAHFRVRIRLQQDGAKGEGQAAGKCEGGLAAVDVDISARGRRRLEPGPAEASAVVDVRRHGDLLDHQEWSRDVDLREGR